jgi:hypothetical protein
MCIWNQDASNDFDNFKFELILKIICVLFGVLGDRCTQRRMQTEMEASKG